MPNTNDHTEDERLAIRCQLGELDAWEQLVRRWQPRIWKFVFRMMGHRERAEDVMQEVWTRAVRSLVRLQNPSKFRSWLFSIARRSIADQLRSEYRQVVTTEYVEVSEEDESLEALEVQEQLHAGLLQLHPIDREAVVMYYFHQLPLAEIASMCNVPAGTIKSRLHRARKQLKETVTEDE